MKNIFQILLLLSIAISPGMAQDVQLPAEVQFRIIQKSLGYLKQFSQNENKEIKLGVLFQENNKISSDIKDDFLSLSGKKNAISNQILIINPIDANKAEALNKNLLQCDAVYVTPLRAFDVKKLGDFLLQHGKFSISATPDNLNDGLIMGFGLENNHPRIFLSATNVKISKIEFSPDFLKMAKIVQ